MKNEQGFWGTLARRNDLWMIILFLTVGTALIIEALRGN